MLDLVVQGGTLVDGTGAPPVTADIGVRDGIVVEIGRLTEAARRRVDADGLLVTPGFVDIHTHFDGQATWDPLLAPSCWHGVTSVAVGNCGVGFAPARPDRRDWLVSLMEGVEDIPGTALSEGLTWRWETFPEYLDELERMPRTVDIGAHVPHAALRAYVMGERGADPAEVPSDDELETMAGLLSEALAAGAVGLGTSRTAVHRTSAGAPIGTLHAAGREMVALAGTLRGTDAVLQLISDCYQTTDPDLVGSELALIEAMADAARRPLSLSVQQSDDAPERWRELQAWAADCAARGLDVRTQVAPRPIGLLLGLTASLHPFAGCPSFRSIDAPGLAELVRALADPGRRQRILSEHEAFRRGLPEHGLARQVMAGFDRMFRMDDPVDYDVRPGTAVGAGTSPDDAAGAAYDALLEDDGRRLLYLPLFNFAGGDLGAVAAMIRSERALFGLSDAGAHCGAICDASFTTSYLTLWARDRADRLPVEDVVSRITRDTARHIGWRDRGTLRPGMLADLNVIDLDALGCAPPRVENDLPAGGRRLVQRAHGYRWTVKAGEVTFVDGEPSGSRPGGLVRGARAAPVPA